MAFQLCGLFCLSETLRSLGPEYPGWPPRKDVPSLVSPGLVRGRCPGCCCPHWFHPGCMQGHLTTRKDPTGLHSWPRSQPGSQPDPWDPRKLESSLLDVTAIWNRSRAVARSSGRTPPHHPRNVLRAPPGGTERSQPPSRCLGWRRRGPVRPLLPHRSKQAPPAGVARAPGASPGPTAALVHWGALRSTGWGTVQASHYILLVTTYTAF